MISLRRSSGGLPFCFGIFHPAVFFLFLSVSFFHAHAEPTYQVEVRVTEEPFLQLLDNQGKVCQTLPMGSVRKHVIVQEIPLWASFGKDSQHHLIVMLGLDAGVSQSVFFLFEKNIIVASPEAILTFQLSSDRSSAEISPSLMGKIWINGSLLSRGETKSLQLRAPRVSGSGIIPSPDQPKPSVKDFQPIHPPSI